MYCNMFDAEHLCNLDTVEKVADAKLKKLVLGRHRQNDPYKCGGCTATFTTVCCLHLHCLKHNEGGSYFFDSLTRTAFPKYETTCVYTQVTFQDIMSDIAELEREANVNAYSENIEPVRVSKRIALRNNSKSKGITNKLKRKIVVKNKHLKLPVKIGKRIEEYISTKEDGTEVIQTDIKHTEDPDSETHCASADIKHTEGPDSETHCVSIEVSCAESENILDDKLDKDYLKPKLEPDTSDAGTMAELSEEENVETNIRKKSSRNINNKNCDTLNLFEKGITESNGHENDELTASEVLLAISKGSNSDLSRTHLLSNGDDGHTLTRKHYSDNSRSEKTTRSEPQARSKRTSKRHADTVKMVECETCGKKGTKGMLAYHKYLHMEGKTFTCEVCGVLFKTPRSLAIHKKQHENKQFLCGYCPASFHRKQYLETHLLKHTGENPFMCDHCGKSYRDRSHLKRHIKHVHDKKRDFECDICGEKFFRSDHLKNHRLRHFEADKKCPYCNRMFKHKEDLARHTRTHTGKKDWYCHICGHGFVAVIPYYAHMAKKHGVNREEAKLWKNKCREDFKKNKQPPKKLSSAGQDSTHNYQKIQNLTSLDETSLVMSTESEVDAHKVFHVKTSDMSTYVDLPTSEIDTSERNVTDSIEEGYAEGNLLIKLASGSDHGKGYTDEELLQVPRTVVSDLIHGSECLDSDGQSAEGLSVDIQDTDFNVIIAVDNMELDGETVMFIDGDQCQSEVIIDN